jgi:hypothetical protein
MKSDFIHLNVHSNYSLLSGAGQVEDLLSRAREMEFDALAITDTNGLYGAMLFLSKARELGIKPILGAEIECDSGDAVCLASDREGYSNLCRVITARQLGENFSLADALARHQEGLFILTPDAALLRRLAGRICDGRLFAWDCRKERPPPSPRSRRKCSRSSDWRNCIAVKSSARFGCRGGCTLSCRGKQRIC